MSSSILLGGGGGTPGKNTKNPIKHFKSIGLFPCGEFGELQEGHRRKLFSDKIAMSLLKTKFYFLRVYKKCSSKDERYGYKNSSVSLLYIMLPSSNIYIDDKVVNLAARLYPEV